MAILELILRYKEYIAIALFFLAVFLCVQYVKGLQKENAELTEKNIQLAINLKTSNDSIKVLKDSINQQNDAVEKLKIAADLRQQANQVAIASAKSTAETFRQQALGLMSANSVGPDKCVSANELINAEILKNAKK